MPFNRIFAVATLAVALFPCVANAQQGGSEAVTEIASAVRAPVVASGAPAGVYFPIANILAEAADGDIDVLATSGSTENLVRLSLGDVDFAIARSDRVAEAMVGLPPFDDGDLSQTLRAVLGLFPEPLTILVRADDGILSLADLEGRVVNIGEPGNATGQLLRLALDVSGQVHERENFNEIPLADQVDALCAGEVDAIAFIAAHPSGTIHRAASTCDMQAVAMGEDDVEALLTANGSLVPAAIPGGLYPGIDDAVNSAGPIAMLVTLSDVDTASVDLLLSGILDDLERISGRHPALGGLSQSVTLAVRNGVPVHDRAASLLADQTGR